MTRRTPPAAAAAALLIALAGCHKAAEPVATQNQSISNIVSTETSPEDRTRAQTPSDAEVISAQGVADPYAGATPMRDRVAVLGLLNKRNGSTRDITLKPGQAVRIGEVILRLRACERTAPWEPDELTGAFVQVDMLQLDKNWHRIFSGWLYKERPALNVVENPIYDVWPKSCAMTFPDKGPDTVTVSGDIGGSSAKKSPDTEGEPSDSPAIESPSAAPSNAM
jgi:hypothetical protein